MDLRVRSVRGLINSSLTKPYRAKVPIRKATATQRPKLPLKILWETLCWVHWYNHDRLMGPLGYMSPAEFEEQYYRNRRASVMVAGLTQ